jgi:hypothetical protein
MCYSNSTIVNIYWHCRKLVYKIIVNRGGYKITYFVASYIYILIQRVILVWQDRVDCYAIGFRYKSSDYLSLVRDRKYIIVTIIMLPSHGIYICTLIGDRAGLDLELDVDLVGQSERCSGCIIPPVSIENRPLLWTLVRSQTYYSEHILAYGSGKTCYSLVMGSSSFWTDC